MGEVVAHLNTENSITAQVSFLRKIWASLHFGVGYRQRAKPEGRQVKHVCSQGDNMVWTGFLCGIRQTRNLCASWARHWAHHILAGAENISDRQHNFQIEIKHQIKPKVCGRKEVGSLNSSWIYHKIPSDFRSVRAVIEHQVGARGVCV